MIHGMIDLETLSTNPNAVILTVGGVKFDPKQKQDIISKVAKGTQGN